jgi:TonB-dependent SusC/RagA subfamily outer membrane receptor
MSLSPRRVSSFHLADVLISAAMIISAGACYNAPSSAPQPSVADVYAQREQLPDKTTPRHFPGVDLVPIGHSAFVVRIHSGLIGDGEPLYLIDGNQMTISPTTGIDWFKPEDITQIRVLKRPDELAIYGPRGVNGVIVITTKQGFGR